MGYLYLLGWVVLKFDVPLSEKLGIPLAKLYTITKNGTWERLFNTHSQNIILFPSTFNDDRFKDDFPFHMIEIKLKYSFPW